MWRWDWRGSQLPQETRTACSTLPQKVKVWAKFHSKLSAEGRASPLDKVEGVGTLQLQVANRVDLAEEEEGSDRSKHTPSLARAWGCRPQVFLKERLHLPSPKGARGCERTERF